MDSSERVLEAMLEELEMGEAPSAIVVAAERDRVAAELVASYEAAHPLLAQVYLQRAIGGLRDSRRLSDVSLVLLVSLHLRGEKCP
jgi:hypothetical protein